MSRDRLPLVAAMRPDVRFNALPWYRRALWYLDFWLDGAIGEINALAKRFYDSQEIDP